ncbi:MAG: hypothetical protein N6V49_00680 [Serratia symbiotica]|nr:hypothetical protein [Serratia symbiotica]
MGPLNVLQGLWRHFLTRCEYRCDHSAGIVFYRDSSGDYVTVIGSNHYGMENNVWNIN